MTDIKRLLASEPLLITEAALMARLVMSIRVTSDIIDKMETRRFGVKLSSDLHLKITEVLDSLPDRFYDAVTPRTIEEYLTYRSSGELPQALEAFKNFSPKLRAVAFLPTSKKKPSLRIYVYAPISWWDSNKIRPLDLLVQEWQVRLTPFVTLKVEPMDSFTNIVADMRQGVVNPDGMKILIGKVPDKSLDYDDTDDVEDDEEGTRRPRPSKIKRVQANNAQVNLNNLVFALQNRPVVNVDVGNNALVPPPENNDDEDNDDEDRVDIRALDGNF